MYLTGIKQKDLFLSDNALVETAWYPADNMLVLFNNAQNAVNTTIFTPNGEVKISLNPMETKLIAL